MKISKNIKASLLVISSIILISSMLLLVLGSLTTNTISVYFIKNVDSDNRQLLAIDRRIPKSESIIKAAMSELLKGPSAKEQKKGLTTEIPSNTTIIDIKENPKEIIINLSKDFETGGGSLSMMHRLEQLIFTATDAANDKPVYLEINGNRVEYIGGEGVEVIQPLQK